MLGSGYVARIPLGGGTTGDVSLPALIFLAGFVVFFATMNYTSFGRTIYAVGGNAEAARLSGVNVAGVRIAVLAITGVLAATSGVLLSSRMMAGNPNHAMGWELAVISAVIVGGTSISGVPVWPARSWDWCSSKS